MRVPRAGAAHDGRGTHTVPVETECRGNRGRTLAGGRRALGRDFLAWPDPAGKLGGSWASPQRCSSGSGYRAYNMNTAFPALLDTSFGKEHRDRGRFAEDSRPEPLVMFDLVTSVQSRPVRLEERVFSTTEGEKLTLDIYKPGYDHGPVPGVLVIHGGSWQSGDSKVFMALNAYLAARDYVVVSMNYRLAPGGSSRRAATTSCRPSRISRSTGTSSASTRHGWAAVGRSAGGQLALSPPTPRTSQRSAASVRLRPDGSKFGYERPASKQLLDTRGVLEAIWAALPQRRTRRTSPHRPSTS